MPTTASVPLKNEKNHPAPCIFTVKVSKLRVGILIYNIWFVLRVSRVWHFKEIVCMVILRYCKPKIEEVVEEEPRPWWPYLHDDREHGQGGAERWSGSGHKIRAVSYSGTKQRCFNIIVLTSLLLGKMHTISANNAQSHIQWSPGQQESLNESSNDYET